MIEDDKKGEINYRKKKFNTSLTFLDQNRASDDDEDEDDDNITVTVPPASLQRGPSYREGTGMVRISSHRSKENYERHNVTDELPREDESLPHKSDQYADSHYYNETYNEQPQELSTQNVSYPPEDPDKNYMAIPTSGAQNLPFPQHNMYSQPGPGSQMPMRPQYGQFPGQSHHQGPFYQQQPK